MSIREEGCGCATSRGPMAAIAVDVRCFSVRMCGPGTGSIIDHWCSDYGCEGDRYQSWYGRGPHTKPRSNGGIMKSIRALLVLLSAVALLALDAPLLVAQTPETGALTGTVTDPSGAVIVGATVTITNLGTGQSRTTTTDASGSYKFSLLPPGSYSAKFSARGFKEAQVSSVTVNVTETLVLNRTLEIGAQSEQVTVESAVETIQTQNATNGGLVGSQEVTDLPLVSRNYTQIVNLSPGVVTNVSSAAAVGNGTQDVAVNGSRQNQNNYSMDGTSIINYVSGTAGQTGSYPGIAIPNPDSIQEFKVQTSQYDASSGRNPGANVDVVTKTGTNQFHGAVWEFNRNNFFNANDFFYKKSELSVGGTGVNTPQILKQNTFGFTLGGPIKKDKLFFFGSYQGIRQINGIGTSGFASGYQSNVHLLPWNDVADFTSGVCTDLRCTNDPAAYRAYLGSVFGHGDNFGIGTGQVVALNGSNLSNTAIALLQAKGIVKGGYNQGFYFPSAPASCGTSDAGCILAISDPTHANENQYMINSQYILSSKHTLEERYLYQSDPQTPTFTCFITPGDCNPGAPENATYTNHVGQLKLVSLLTSNFVNEVRFSFQRNIEDSRDPAITQSCALPNSAYIIPLENNGLPCPPRNTSFSEFNIVPILDILGIASPSGPWSQGGSFSTTSTNYINTFQWADQISWNHGKHAIRAGFEAERIQYNNTIPASGRGELLMYNTADFLTSSAGPPGTNPLDPTYNDGTPATPNGGIVFGFGLKGALTHYNRINAFDSYVQDDMKVSRKLTVNLGVRWEYDGFPDDISGQFSNVWGSQLAKINTGSYFLNNPTGTLVGFVVPSNFAVKQFGLTAPNGASGVLVNSNKTLVPGSPWHNFAPRLGVAWQPLNDRFVVRAGYGWFYDRIYGNLLIDNQLNLPPYSGAGSGPFPQSLANTLHNPWEAGAGPLVWTPRYITCAGPCTTNGAFISSGLGYTSDSPEMANRLPVTYEYNLDLQYEFAHGWVADIGYVGTHGIHVYNWSQDVNVAHLVAGAPNEPTAAQDTGLIATSLPFNDPANTTPVTVNTTGNVNERVSYLGFSPAGVATTNTNGDSLYNSLQAQLKHQFSRGLLLQVAYTWSQAITNVNTAEAGSGINPPGEVIYSSTNSNNPLDLAQQYGPASFNRPQRAIISYSYDLPWKGTEGVTGKLLSGWTLSGVTTIQNGEPFTPTDSQGGSIFFGVGTDSRAALADPVDCSAATGNCKSGIPITSSGSTTSRALTNWLNPAAFIPLTANSATPLPASSPYCIGGTPNPTGSASAPCGSPASTFPGAGTGFGNGGVGTVLGPGQFNWDMALLKNTKLWEHGTLQFRAELYNIWNHPQFAPPFGVDASTPSTFGFITATSTTPRVIQFGLKYLF
jgi:Carboxypeptidase regulatory-like domain